MIFSFGADFKSFFHGADFLEFNDPEDFKPFALTEKPSSFSGTIRQNINPGNKQIYYGISFCNFSTIVHTSSANPIHTFIVSTTPASLTVDSLSNEENGKEGSVGCIIKHK